MYRLALYVAVAIAGLGACTNSDFLFPQPEGEVIPSPGCAEPDTIFE